MRPSWVEVDLDAIMHNVRTIKSAVAPSLFCAVVKADGYGHGDVPAAEAALEAGADWLAVALVEEGVRLREAGIGAPVLLLSEPAQQDAAAVVEWGLVPTLYTDGFREHLAAVVTDGPLPVHVKVDTGMHRVGADVTDATRLVKAVVDDGRLELAGLWTHFAVAEEDAAFTEDQLDRLMRFRDGLTQPRLEPLLHAANTAGALAHPAARLDMVRVGLGVYGLRPAPDVGRDLDLRPAMRVRSEVSLVRRLAAGARPSYGRRRALPDDAFVATVPIGYADGVARRLSSVGGEVLIRGKRMPYAGTVTMDQIVVDAGNEDVAVGDEVVLLGQQGSATISAEEWAEWLDTINYEIVCDFGPRLPRKYVRSQGEVNG